MSHLNPYRDFVTLTGEIYHQLRGLVNLMEQHSAIHNGETKKFAMELKSLADRWEKLPYPHNVDHNNNSFA